jgi:hypothetical protein
MINGLHPYLPCERCFRVPPGPDTGRKAKAPVCRCVAPEVYAKVEERYLENREREEATKVWKYPAGMAA